MKNKIMMILTLILTCANMAHAQLRDRIGNGGDACENRIQTIRDDVATWISNGGSANLALPSPITLDQYNKGMLAQMASAKISCTDKAILIGATEKTCMNNTGPDGIPFITCNAQRFMKTEDVDQYVLVHHEYAGLAGFEMNSGEASTYVISNQLTAYLEDQVVKKLVVRPKPASDMSLTVRGNKAYLIGAATQSCSNFLNVTLAPASNSPINDVPAWGVSFRGATFTWRNTTDTAYISAINIDVDNGDLIIKCTIAGNELEALFFAFNTTQHWNGSLAPAPSASSPTILSTTDRCRIRCGGIAFPSRNKNFTVTGKMTVFGVQADPHGDEKYFQTSAPVTVMNSP